MGRSAPGPAQAEVPLADKVAFLADPAHHPPPRPQRIETRETHLSWVFLGDRLVHKLKKPVRRAPVDLSTLARRHRNCLAELHLNRRLAAEIYLGLQPLTHLPGRGLALGPPGRVVEWLVVMRRLDEARMLDRALARGGPQARDLDRVAARLARFHRSLAREPIGPEARRAWFESEIRRSHKLLTGQGIEGDRVDRVAGRLLDHLRARPELLRARHAEGWIVEGHGDLRPEHVALGLEPLVIDCLEFSRTLRLVDPADEIAYLALECAMLGAPGAGQRLQEAHAAALDDRPPEALLAFYSAFRALLRARLVALHAREPAPRTPAWWLARANAYLEAALARSELVA